MAAWFERLAGGARPNSPSAHGSWRRRRAPSDGRGAKPSGRGAVGAGPELPAPSKRRPTRRRLPGAVRRTSRPACRRARPGNRPASRPGPDPARCPRGPRPAAGAGLYPAWRRAAAVAPGTAQLLRDLLAMRVTAAPFGATAPLKPVQDDKGRVIRSADWPLTGAVLTSMRVVHDTAGKAPIRAEFQYVEGNGSDQRASAAARHRADHLRRSGPGRVDLSTRRSRTRTTTSSWLGRRPADSQEPGVTARLLRRSARVHPVRVPSGRGRPVHVGDPQRRPRRSSPCARATTEQVTHGEYEVSLRYALGSEPSPSRRDRHRRQCRSPPTAACCSSTPCTPASRSAAGSRSSAPRKGAEDGIPGDTELAFVTTRVIAVRTAAYTNYGITGRGTELTLADPWLDEYDVLLSHDPRHHRARGGRAAAPGRRAARRGRPRQRDRTRRAVRRAARRTARSSSPASAPTSRARPASRATELVDDRRRRADAWTRELPGDHVHTELTLTADLAYRYRRDTVRVLGNVVAATHGESRDEADRQRRRGPRPPDVRPLAVPADLAAADNPLGATPRAGDPGRRAAVARGRQPCRTRPARADLRHRHRRRRPDDGHLRRRRARGPAAHRARERPRPLPLRHRHRPPTSPPTASPSPSPARSASPPSPTRCPATGGADARRPRPDPPDHPAGGLRARPARLGPPTTRTSPAPARASAGPPARELFDGRRRCCT